MTAAQNEPTESTTHQFRPNPRVGEKHRPYNKGNLGYTYTIYRFYTADDTLLYIGETARVRKRIIDHQMGNPEACRSVTTMAPSRGGGRRPGSSWSIYRPGPPNGRRWPSSGSRSSGSIPCTTATTTTTISIGPAATGPSTTPTSRSIWPPRSTSGTTASCAA